MKLFPETFFQQIEFDKILELASLRAYNERTRERILGLMPMVDVDRIQNALDEVEAYVKTVENDHKLPLSSFETISESLRLLSIEDYVLGEDELLDIGNQLFLCAILRQWLDNQKEKLYPSLCEIVQELPDTSDLLNDFQLIFNEEGKIRPNASPALVQISAEIDLNIRRMNSAFDRVVKKYKDQNWLADSLESYRNGRRVLSVKAENKRKITGIIHGESNGGRIFYIEPDEIVPINNNQFELENERRKEIYRILKTYCQKLRFSIPELEREFEVLLHLDFIRAKGELALLIEGRKPKIVDQPRLKMSEVRHPLLWLKNKKDGLDVVPYNLQLHGQNHLLLISGPNAGGKSITLKAAAICQVMIQCGLLISTHENSEFGVFHSFFSDIGDQQSIDESLSTYSSRLRNMKRVLENADEKSFIVIDEFGSGTDPILGAALAESILHQFVKKRLWGVITTHYSNLKIYAFKTKGIVNAGMLFDEKTLNPTYQLKIGKPGSSYAFEIAQKTGLAKHILSYAKNKAGKNNLALEKMIASLEADQKRASSLTEGLSDKEAKLERLIRNYEELRADLDLKRRKLKMEQKEQDFNYEERLRKEIEKMRKELKKKQSDQVLKAKQQEIVERKQELASDINKLEEQVFEQEAGPEFWEELKEGDYVRIIKTGMKGKVQSKGANKVLIEVGNMTMEAKRASIGPAEKPLDIKKGNSIRTSIASHSQTFSPKLDIRGQKFNEAKETLQTFMDEAIMSNAYQLRILHGKGSGALKKLVRQVLREYKDVKEIYHPSDTQGGEGVTIVEF